MRNRDWQRGREAGEADARGHIRRLAESLQWFVDFVDAGVERSYELRYVAATKWMKEAKAALGAITADDGDRGKKTGVAPTPASKEVER